VQGVDRDYPGIYQDDSPAGMQAVCDRAGRTELIRQRLAYDERMGLSRFQSSIDAKFSCHRPRLPQDSLLNEPFVEYLTPLCRARRACGAQWQPPQ
jgi:hypothetical protein